MPMWVNPLATVEIPSRCEMEGCQQSPTAVAAHIRDREQLDTWAPGSRVEIEIAWGCAEHADPVAAGRAQWELLGRCEPREGECQNPVTHIAVLTETAKNTIIVSELCKTHADEVEHQRVDSIVPDYPPGD
jgi:hypothetical protein